MATLKKTGLAAALAVAVVVTTPALSGPIENVNIKDGNGNTLIGNVNELDWNASSTGDAVGKGPVGSDPTLPPNPFSFLYQSNLVAYNDSLGNPLPAPGLNTSYEFTIVANVTELAVLPGGPTALLFPVGGYLSIFYDDLTDGSGAQSNATTGAGFADGVEVARFQLVGGLSNFTLLNGTGVGGTQYEFDVFGNLLFVNANYIEGLLSPVVDLHFFATQNYPPTVAPPTQYFAGSIADPPYTPYSPDTTCTTEAGSCDLFLKVDGSNRFSRIPEPGTIALLAGGLLGLSFRVRQSWKAVRT